MKYNELSAIWRNINQQWGTQTHGLLVSLELTHTDRMVLMTISSHPNSTKTDIANSINVRTQSLTRSINRMVEKQLILKSKHQSDKRACSFYLTPAGEEKIIALEKHNDTLWKKALLDFGQNEKKQLSFQLERLLNNLNKNQTEPDSEKQA